jgi:hypothetical protein
MRHRDVFWCGVRPQWIETKSQALDFSPVRFADAETHDVPALLKFQPNGQQWM